MTEHGRHMLREIRLRGTHHFQIKGELESSRLRQYCRDRIINAWAVGLGWRDWCGTFRSEIGSLRKVEVVVDSEVSNVVRTFDNLSENF